MLSQTGYRSRGGIPKAAYENFKEKEFGEDDSRIEDRKTKITKPTKERNMTNKKREWLQIKWKEADQKARDPAHPRSLEEKDLSLSLFSNEHSGFIFCVKV